MSNNTADTSVVDAVPAVDAAATTDGVAKRLTGDKRRREILDAVRTVSSELGVSHLSVSAVTKRAGCTRSLFYHYFADMEKYIYRRMSGIRISCHCQSCNWIPV